MQDVTPSHAPGRPDEPLRELLAAVLEALDIPHAATVGGEEAYRQVLEDRAMHARIALQGVLDDPDAGPAGLAWTTQYLRERLAEHPPTGYVTLDEARARMAAGASWTDAVQPTGVAR